MNVLVTGATGFVGRRLIPALVAAGHEVTALVRDATHYEPQPGVRVVEGDLLRPGSYEDAFDVEAAYYLVHSMRSGGDFEARDRDAARNFATAASEHGVERVIYLGGLGEDRDRLSEHLRSRREVEQVLAAGNYELTTLRAAILIGAGSASFEMITQLATRLPVMVTPRWVRTPCQPIFIDDAIAYLVGVLEVPATAGETYEIGGPDVLTYREILARVGGILGREPVIVPLPMLTPKLSSLWIGFVTDVPAAVARPLIAGLKNPVVVQDHRIESLVDIELTPFDEAVRRALGTSAGAGGDGDAGTPPAAGSDNDLTPDTAQTSDDVETASAGEFSPADGFSSLSEDTVLDDAQEPTRTGTGGATR